MSELQLWKRFVLQNLGSACKMAITVMALPYLTLFSLTILPILSYKLSNCPLWYQRDGATGECVCGSSLNGVIHCHTHNHTVSIRTCYCMTMDESNLKPVVASCLYTCDYLHQNFRSHVITNLVETNSTSDIEIRTCGRYNRQGVLCSKCMEGYGLPVYSYNISCDPCKDRWYNWVKYIAVVYVPLTVFVLIIIFFRFSANSGSMVVYVTVSQMMTNKSVVSLYLLVNNYNLPLKISVALYSLWSLDIFRSLNTNFCLHPNLSKLQILMLDYLAALYPMVFVILTYLIVYWHGQSQTFACFCRPFYICMHRCKKEWNVKNSLIEAFATLIMLSFVKILHITFEILNFTYYYDMTYRSSPRLVHADPSIKYLSMEHLPSFVVAISISFTFNFLPFLLLCVYPYSCTQRFLNRAGLNCQALSTLMDAFNGCYKIKPKFLQSFSAVCLIANFLGILMYVGLDNSLYHTGISYILVTWILLLSLLAPYRNESHNQISILLISLVFLANNGIVISLESEVFKPIKEIWWEGINLFLITIGSLSLPVYGLLQLLKYVMPRKVKKYFEHIVTKGLTKTGVYNKDALSDSLPYRCQFKDDIVPLSNANYRI